MVSLWGPSCSCKRDLVPSEQGFRSNDCRHEVDTSRASTVCQRGKNNSGPIRTTVHLSSGIDRGIRGELVPSSKQPDESPLVARIHLCYPPGEATESS